MPSLRSAGPSWGRSRSRWSSSACSWSWRSWARSTSRGRTSEPERVPHARRAGLRDRPLRRPHAAQRDRDPARDRADAQRREHQPGGLRPLPRRPPGAGLHALHDRDHRRRGRGGAGDRHRDLPRTTDGRGRPPRPAQGLDRAHRRRSEEHTSELQSLITISYAVFCLKKKKKKYKKRKKQKKRKHIKKKK